MCNDFVLFIANSSYKHTIAIVTMTTTTVRYYYSV